MCDSDSPFRVKGAAPRGKKKTMSLWKLDGIRENSYVYKTRGDFDARNHFLMDAPTHFSEERTIARAVLVKKKGKNPRIRRLHERFFDDNYTVCV